MLALGGSLVKGDQLMSSALVGRGEISNSKLCFPWTNIDPGPRLQYSGIHTQENSEQSKTFHKAEEFRLTHTTTYCDCFDKHKPMNIKSNTANTAIRVNTAKIA